MCCKYVDASKPSKDLEMDLDEIHEAEHGMLEAIGTYCTNNDITWCLAYGTLLGTVRDGGLIQWDDDADIWMTRPNFEKFCKGWKDTQRYHLIRPFSPGYGFGWAKIVDKKTQYWNPRIILPDDYGLALDIFVRDAACGRDAFAKIHREKHMRELAWVTARLQRGHLAKYLAKTFARVALRLLPVTMYDESAYLKSLLSGQQSDQQSLTHNINALSGYDYDRDLLENSWFESYLIADCDDHKYPVPVGSEQILEHIYGEDWRTPVKYPRHAYLYWRRK